MPRSPTLKFSPDAFAAPAPPTASALDALRQATREHHARIDRLMDLPRLQERPRYGRVLQAFDAFLAPWEESVAHALPARWHGWLHDRSRRSFLREDLAVLKLRPLPAPPVPPLASAAEAWGSLYVIEGSALGGQVIARALAHSGTGPDSGAAYFHGWGADTPGLWHEFRARLLEELPGPAQVAAACAAACATFDALAAHLESTLDERIALA